MSTVHSEQIMMWQERVRNVRGDVAAKRQSLRADPASGNDDPMRTGLDAVGDQLDAALTLLQHLWLLADITH